jgi:hypothetical protein
MDCNQITPVSAFQSSNLNSKINSFGRLADRITRALGAPMVNVEIHHDQLFENISIACEFFSKFAGYTTEYLIFDSNLYTPNKGIKLDDLFSITPYFNRINQPSASVYVAVSAVSNSFFTSSITLSATYPDGIYVNQILSSTDYLSVLNVNSALSAYFSGSANDTNKYANNFDYDVMDYRKVMDVVDFEEGSTTGVNTLFTIEQTLAQQTYFSYAMGNYGFDLISWYVLKDWLENREKLLAQKRSFVFNDRTQYLVMHPSPGTGSSTKFYGIISCYVERPLRDIIKEQWVYQYALALSKISIGNVRGKYTGTTLFGGGQINIDMLAQGLAEKEKLEDRLLNGASAGFGDSDPPMMMIG